jgi:hypothetical protein
MKQNSLGFFVSYSRNNQIPRTLIKEKVLQNRLNELASNIAKEGYFYATDIKGLFEMAVPDCIFPLTKLGLPNRSHYSQQVFHMIFSK